MKAKCSATSEEISVILTKNEISQLEKSVLKGIMKIPSEKGLLARPLDIKIGEINPDSCFNFVEIIHHPKNSNYLESRRFDIIISDQSYQKLKNDGLAGDRGSWGCKLLIYEESKIRGY